MKKAKVAPPKAAPVKTAPPKKISIVKVIRLKAKPGPTGMSEIELVLAKPVGVFKKFYFSDIPSSSKNLRVEGHRAVQVVSERASHVISFDNLDDSCQMPAKPPYRGKLLLCRHL
jgi:hypothetical protein